MQFTTHIQRIVTAVILLCGATAHAETEWARTSNALEFAVYAGVGADGDGDVTPFGGGQVGFCILCLYLNFGNFRIGDSHSLYYGFPLGGAIAEGGLVQYGISKDVDVGARLLYQIHGNVSGGRQGLLGVVEGRWKRITGSVSFHLEDNAYLEGAVRYMLDEIYGLKLHVIHIEGTELRISYGGYLF